MLRFPPRLQALVGYATYGGLLGHGDPRSPAVLLDPDAPSDRVWRKLR